MGPPVELLDGVPMVVSEWGLPLNCFWVCRQVAVSEWGRPLKCCWICQLRECVCVVGGLGFRWSGMGTGPQGLMFAQRVTFHQRCGSLWSVVPPESCWTIRVLRSAHYF
jgi:hypothetical protein